MMVSFMCQLGQATVLKDLTMHTQVLHRTGFQMRVTFELVDLSQSVEGLMKKTGVPKDEEVCLQTAFRLGYFHGPPACWPALQILGSASLRNHMGNFLK